jgi:hypothetical protein
MRKPTRLLLLTPGLILLAGCANKLTRERFDMIRVELDGKEDVRLILGDPKADFGDEWMYDDLDRHVSAIVFFDDRGKVAGKEWMDARSSAWEGYKSGEEPSGEERERRRTTRTYDD